MMILFCQIQSDEQDFKIKSDDLRGFWDMVVIQIDEVYNAFRELDKSKDNHWSLDEVFLG